MPKPLADRRRLSSTQQFAMNWPAIAAAAALAALLAAYVGFTLARPARFAAHLEPPRAKQAPKIWVTAELPPPPGWAQVGNAAMSTEPSVVVADATVKPAGDPRRLETRKAATVAVAAVHPREATLGPSAGSVKSALAFGPLAEAELRNDSAARRPDYPNPTPLDFRASDDLCDELERVAVDLDLRSISGLVEKPLPDPAGGSAAKAPNASHGPSRLQDPTIPAGSLLDQVMGDTFEITELSDNYGELRGLPFRRGTACQKDQVVAAEMGQVSTYLHQSLRIGLVLGRSPASELSESDVVRRIESAVRLAKDPKLQSLAAASVVNQVLQVEEVPERISLVSILSGNRSAEASIALADRAVFDLAAEVRQAAREALTKRPPVEFRQRLLDGLRYPWPPVAEHAAEALIAVDDREAAVSLALMVELPEPTAPFRNERGTWVKRELVRVNHLRNCLLCHAPSASVRDLVRGAMPIPGESLPRVYYCDPRANFVRADVTYLRQDFSVMRTVAKSDKWPALQRYDYLVRLRELNPAEIAIATSSKPPSAGHESYPQQTAVLYALRALSPPKSPSQLPAGPASDHTAAAGP